MSQLLFVKRSVVYDGTKPYILLDPAASRGSVAGEEMKHTSNMSLSKIQYTLFDMSHVRPIELLKNCLYIEFISSE